MYPRLATVALLALSHTALGWIEKRGPIEDCLAKAGVPMDTHGSDEWMQDAAPFNLRLNYTPVAIAVPTNIKQIQDAVACGVKLGVKTNPKCGGHSYASFGLGGEDGHLTIEMDRMDLVTLDNVTGIAVVQGGARLGQLPRSCTPKASVTSATAHVQGTLFPPHSHMCWPQCPARPSPAGSGVPLTDKHASAESASEAMPCTAGSASARAPRGWRSTPWWARSWCSPTRAWWTAP